MPETVQTDPVDIVDLQFGLRGLRVPADYADLLSLAVQEVLPWFADDPLAGMHPISGLSPGGDFWNLSRRSHLTLRLPRERVDAATALAGKSLAIGGEPVEIGDFAVHELAYSSVIYCKFVAFAAANPSGEAMSETSFAAACQARFAALNIQPDMVCGKAQRSGTATGLISGFSLMLSRLDAETNLHLQRHGLGVERKRGCGIFVPHKSFAAVRTLE